MLMHLCVEKGYTVSILNSIDEYSEVVGKYTLSIYTINMRIIRINFFNSHISKSFSKRRLTIVQHRVEDVKMKTLMRCDMTCPLKRLRLVIILNTERTENPRLLT